MKKPRSGNDSIEASDQLSTPHLLGIQDLSAADIELIFLTADGFKEVLGRPIKKVPTLATSPLPIYSSKAAPVHA